MANCIHVQGAADHGARKSLKIGGSIVIWRLEEVAGLIPAHLADRIVYRSDDA